MDQPDTERAHHVRQTLLLKLGLWIESAPRTPDHPLRHPASKDASGEKTDDKPPKRRLFWHSRRSSTKQVLECFFKYNDRKRD